MKALTYEEYLPDYSICYLINADPSGIDDSDIKAIDEFMDYYYALADEHKGYVVIEPLDDEPSFNHFPAFGLACDTFRCNINILYT